MINALALKTEALRLGASTAGIARAGPATNEAFFSEWLRRGYAGDMTYLHKYQDLRFDPSRLLTGARSVIVVGLNYYPSEASLTERQPPFRVAKYAWGEDYHRLLRKLLKRLRRWVAGQAEGAQGRICVDTAPFPDKYWAERAGIGWQGKNTNLVSREYGSWLLIGSLITTAEIDHYDDPHIDFCGSCTACLDRCPTAAFPQPGVLDATRCLSYWTIESKSPEIPAVIARNMESWIFGCDLCLDICPWNKFQKPHTEPGLRRHPDLAQVESGGVMKIPEDTFNRRYAASPILRPGWQGIVRNTEAASGSVRP